MNEDRGFAARCLLRSASSATLATQGDGQPFASLVTHAVAPDGALLMWLSSMSQHTRQLLREPRCALMAQGAPVETNPQTAPRVTVTGVAERIEDVELKARWLARHPYALLYAEFGDFALWRLLPAGGMLVGGFAAAYRLGAADLNLETRELSEAEAGIIAHVNADHADTLALLAAEAGDWRMTAVDADGFDLTAGDRVVRHAFPAPVKDADGVRKALILAARAARAG